jgi:SpoVK/Ycf46/Vps4 family AAA+-type ATPase
MVRIELLYREILYHFVRQGFSLTGVHYFLLAAIFTAYTEAESVASHCSVLFFDEIDALGHSRGPTGGNTSQDGGDGCSRRVLAELLIQLTQLADRANREESCDELDCSSDADDSPNTAGRKHSPRVIVVAATNRPEDCDAALLRRFPVRVHVGLPSQRDRRKIFSKFLGEFGHNITASQLEELAAATDGWSGSDLESLTREAAMAPIRECLRHAATMKRRARKREQKGGDESSQQEQRKSVDADEEAREVLLSSFNKLRPVTLRDFEAAMEFWLGNQQTTFIGEIPQEVSHVHYDSSSSSEEEDN